MQKNTSNICSNVEKNHKQILYLGNISDIGTKKLFEDFDNEELIGRLWIEAYSFKNYYHKERNTSNPNIVNNILF